MIDIVLSAVGLFVLSPVLVAVAVAIKAHDGGPILHRSRHVVPDLRGWQETAAATHEYLGLSYYWFHGWTYPRASVLA